MVNHFDAPEWDVLEVRRPTSDLDRRSVSCSRRGGEVLLHADLVSSEIPPVRLGQLADLGASGPRTPCCIGHVGRVPPHHARGVGCRSVPGGRSCAADRGDQVLRRCQVEIFDASFCSGRHDGMKLG